ncbi:ParA family protein [Planctomyces sp. SH-PL62]|uniref:ParA family protein n=1 Tax=Planctomyces sp. SH-PL62 TaxID=1636152 RepID=UPI00078D014E|nr:ParA family protein [Planctomyces sp. SH-PL62]AMV40228.1 Sporulation initiation inhibitor protein Soj [Planctomyces sp. SH-PL62]
MRIITFVTQKGGAGKTTLAINCAIAAELKKHRVLILDLDPQASSEGWYQDREADSPKLVKIDSWSLPDAIAKANSAGFDLVIIDTPGRDEPSTTAAIRCADFCIIPCRPTPVDLRAVPPTVATINRLSKSAVFVLTQTPPRGERLREAEAGLSMLGIVSPVRIVTRAAYQDALGAGLGVMEYEPEGKAATEIRQLWNWIEKKMEKIAYDSEKTHIA